jgi:hypothetical protein
MKLRDARLCLDCDEVHQDATCPACSSESFAFLSRWVPAPEGQRAPRPSSSEQAEVYRALLGEAPAAANRRLLGGGLLGLTAIGIAGWAWRRSRSSDPDGHARGTTPPDHS